MLDRSKLIRQLASWNDEADVAAESLADNGDRAALPDILRSILRECGMEYIPKRRIDAFIRLARAEDVPMLLKELESLDEAELEGDAGDIGDEFWRITWAIESILVGIGVPAVEQIRGAFMATRNPFTRSCLSNAFIKIVGVRGIFERGAAAVKQWFAKQDAHDTVEGLDLLLLAHISSSRADTEYDSDRKAAKDWAEAAAAGLQFLTRHAAPAVAESAGEDLSKLLASKYLAPGT